MNSSTDTSSTNTSTSFFNSIEPAPPDAILGLNEAFRNDPNPEKINLTVGVYQDEQGRTPIFRCIRMAEKRLAETETDKSYLGIDGSRDYAVAVQKLLFGAESGPVVDHRLATAQSPGGTGGLRISADFLKRRFPGTTVWFSNPTWANHPAIFSAAGLNTAKYEYLDANRTGLDFNAMVDSLQNTSPGDVLVLHGCCHNPTGVDLAPEHWDQVAEICAQRQLLPLVDCAYQGFNDGLEQDTAGIRRLEKAGLEMIVCSSFSKNLGLYGERVGAMTLVAENRDAAAAALSHIKSCIRVNYSNPPKHGAALATIVLTDEELTAIWQDELQQVRNRIKNVRARFVAEMNARCDRDFSYIQQQNGMFSYTGLTPVQVDTLKKEYSIYIVGAGRINVAGINDSNLQRLCDCIARVL